MRPLTYRWTDADGAHELRFVAVPGTVGRPFLFGGSSGGRSVEIRDFSLTTTPVTQALWSRVMGDNPSVRKGARLPVENVSWEHIVGPGGFLERVNESDVRVALAAADPTMRLRLPSETEWEYAARGGPRWMDGFTFAGSDDPDEVAWYGPRFTKARRLVCRVLGWRRGWRLVGRFPRRRPTRTHEVATKAPNQLGLYDMCGNVWEWCQDTCIEDLEAVPSDGTPYVGEGSERRLRGGSHQNWDIHCSVWWRYGIAREFHDGCIGFRLALGAPSTGALTP